MPRPLAHPLNALLAAFALMVISSALAQTKPPSLVGKTRDQLVEQLGQPKSSLKAGAREVMFFDHVKITMRNGVAIDSEAMADDPAPAKRAGETAPSGAAPVAATASAAPAPAPVVQTPANTPALSTLGPAAAAEALALARPPPPPPEAAAAPTKAPEPTLAIKFIKSGGAAKSAPRPTGTASKSAPAAAAAVTAAETKMPAKAAVAALDSKAAAPSVPESKAAVAGTTPTVRETEQDVVAAAPETPAVDEETPAKPTVDPKKKAAVRQRWRLRRDNETEEDRVQIFSAQSYVIGALVIAAGAGFLWWQRSQRALALAASMVSHTPFEAEAAGPADATGVFSAEQIGKLGQKKFERLVASYYAKTGVVAERTNAGPESPVHIKIFWKGEAKPFAGVQCHANPPALVGPKPLLELFAALSGADIRRGYVVTTGKFNVEARDLAEEKHFTLLSGDIFLEKINALPPAARADLLKETNTEEPAAPVA